MLGYLLVAGFAMLIGIVWGKSIGLNLAINKMEPRAEIIEEPDHKLTGEKYVKFIIEYVYDGSNYLHTFAMLTEGEVTTVQRIFVEDKILDKAWSKFLDEMKMYILGLG